MAPINLLEQLQQEAMPLVMADERHFPNQHACRRQLHHCLEQLLTKDRLNLFVRLTHLIAIAHQSKVDFAQLFFVCPATKSHLASLFFRADCQTNRPGEISIVYADQSKFSIQFDSLVYLVLAGNLVAELLGFSEFSRKSREISDAGTRRNLVDSIAEDWAKLFDQYRQKRGGSSQQERQFRAIVDFLHRHHNQGEFCPVDIHSQHVLDFWASHWYLKGLSLQRHQKVHDRFIIFVEQFAVEQQQRFSAQSPSSPNSDTDHLDGFSQDHSVSYTSAIEDWLALSKDHQDIKFLGEAALNRLRCLADLPLCAANLSLSALRAETFSLLENKLIQLRRERAEVSELEALLTEEGSTALVTHYDTTLQEFTQTIDLFRLSCLASAYILIHHNHSEGLKLLYQLDPTLGGEEGFFNDIAAMSILPPLWDKELLEADFFEQISEDFFATLADASVPGHVRQAMANAKSAWSQINRRGFSRTEKDNSEILESHAFAAARIPNALSHLQASQRRLRSQVPDLNLQMRGDMERMRQILSDIYLSPSLTEDLV